MIKVVIKRDGTKEEFDATKLNKWGEWASQKLKRVDWSTVVLNAVSTSTVECKSTKLQENLIRACLDQDSWEYNKMAGRLLSVMMVKQIFGSKGYPKLKDLHNTLQKKGLMAKLDYTEDEYATLDKYLDHSKDQDAAYFEITQSRDKYALRDAVTKEVFETQQFTYMRMAMALAESRFNGVEKVKIAKDFYDEFSNKKLNAPTPNYINLGTLLNGYASCFPAGSLVTVKGGYKKIEDVIVGDEVVTHTNELKRVYNTQTKPYSGKFSIINSVATFGDELRPTEDHKIFAIKRATANYLKSIDKDINRDWIKADNLRSGDYVKLSYDKYLDIKDIKVWDIIKNLLNEEDNITCNGDLITKNLKYQTPNATIQQPDIINFSIKNQSWFRLFGYFLAEGCVCYPKRGNKYTIFTFNINEKEYIEDVKNIIEGVGGRVSIYKNEEDNSAKITCYSKVITLLLEELLGCGFNSKKLPTIIMQSDTKLQEQLLAGVIRGDGCAIKSGFSLTLHNVYLIRQLRDIALRCSLRIRVSKSGGIRKGKTAEDANLTILASGDDNFTKLVGKDIHKIKNIKMKGNNILFLSDGAYARIKNLKSYNSSEPVYDLAVEEDASFSVSGVSVHNCAIYTTNDSAKSLAIGDHIAYTMTCMSAGMGGMIKTRSEGSPVRSGAVQHSGKLPYYRSLVGAINANKQAGRGGACTTYYSAFDPQVETIMRLKNQRSTDSKKIRGLDYAFSQNKVFAKRVALNQDITLFDCYSEPELFEAMYNKDASVFEKLYKEYEENNVRVKTCINARELLLQAMTEGFETGRHYLFQTDEANRHNPFKDSVYSSNLCLEYISPTKGYDDMRDLYSTEDHGRGEIGLCSLGAINVSNIKNDKEYEKTAYLALLMIDICIHKNDWALPHLGVTALSRLNAGVGMVGLAHRMAKEGFKYSSQEGKDFIHELAETHAWHLYNASLRLGKEYGNAPWMHKTLWPEGWLPIDTYNKNVDNVVTVENKRDWEGLRASIVDNGGVRFSICINYMPAETSSKASGTTNAIYPIRELTLKKTDNGSSTYWAAPEGERLKDKYEFSWDIEVKDMIDCYSILQKWCDQSISADFYKKVELDKIPSYELIDEYLYMVKMGMKTRYYYNSMTSKKVKLDETPDVLDDDSGECEEGVCKL